MSDQKGVRLSKLAKEFNVPLLLPHTSLSTDNALMIALAGALRVDKTTSDFVARGNLSL